MLQKAEEVAKVIRRMGKRCTDKNRNRKSPAKVSVEALDEFNELKMFSK